MVITYGGSGGYCGMMCVLHARTGFTVASLGVSEIFWGQVGEGYSAQLVVSVQPFRVPSLPNDQP